MLIGFGAMEPKCVLDFIKGYGTMTEKNVNGRTGAPCSRLRQAAGPGHKRANTKDEEGRNGRASIMPLTTQIHRESTTFFFLSASELLQEFTWKFMCTVHAVRVHLSLLLTCLWCAEPCSGGPFPRRPWSAGTSAPLLTSSRLVLPSSVSLFPGRAPPQLSEQHTYK